jgi:predicted Zn-dependent protease
VISTAEPRFSTDHAGQGQRIDFASPPRLITVAFTLLWLSGWLLLCTITVLQYKRFGSLDLLSIAMLAVGGPPVVLALLWVSFGKRESLLVSPARIRIERWAGPVRLTRTFESHAIRGLRVTTAWEGPLADLAAIRHFYSGGNGRIEFHTDRGTLTVGHDVSTEAADRIVDHTRQLVPHLPGVPAERGVRRRMAHHAAAFMTMTMLGFALNVPVRLAIVDRPICFYDDTSVPLEAIDVSVLRPTGRVVLVPIDDFPADRARAIADYFATTFGVRIDVAPAMTWPENAYVPERRQMNSAVMLTRLEEAYVTAIPPVIAIALTTRDMFNPAVNWAYVFSYRRNNRVAVVSPARMDRGCMGVFSADESRIMARLRKMVGKNIGLMYFGLEMSTDPLSMLYANIGGPQELDAMSERF